MSKRSAANENIEERIDQLLKKMTLEEKIGQTAARGIFKEEKGSLPAELITAVKQGKVGAFINVMDREMVEQLQQFAVEESPSNIPLLFARDVTHGFKTIFPIPLGLAASWNIDLVEENARMAAIEASAYGIRWTFAPMVDVTRDPHWSRIAESFGEDPYLVSKLSVAMLNGFQGKDLSDETSIAACIKHYAGYSALEGGRDNNSTYIPESLLHNIYLPSFKACVDAGAATFMTSRNELNNIPATGNYYLLTDILKQKWNFDGFIVSDWDSVPQMVNHGYAADNKQAAERAASAGLDMEMASSAYENYLAGLIHEGKVSETKLDDFVRRILRIKLRLGLFDRPGLNSECKSVIQKPEYLSSAKQAAIESLVLLKNENEVLPLSIEQTVAVIGPLADAPHDQLGTWVFDADEATTQTPYSALVNFLGDNKVFYSPGLTNTTLKDETVFEEAITAAQQADIIMLFCGEEAIQASEAHNNTDICLSGVQQELILELSKTGKPLVMVIMAGRPIIIRNIIDKVDAIMMAWHPGTMGGAALVDVFYGFQAPSGRLPITWPKSSLQTPIYYNHTNKRFIAIADKQAENAQGTLTNNTSYDLAPGYEPEFPFGFGLSYTLFEYKNMKISQSEIKRNGSLNVSVDIKNVGNYSAIETVQLYIQDVVGELTRPAKELKKFKRVKLKSGESKQVNFILKAKDLAYCHADGNWSVDPGEFNIWVAPNSTQGLETSFKIE